MGSNVVAFGVRKRYILCAGTTATYADLPVPVTAHLDRANDLHHFTTCAFGLSRNSYFISYRTKSGQDRTFLNCLPTKLARWLAPNGLVVGRDLDTLQLTIGYNNSFYAADDEEVCYDGLPVSLVRKLGELGVQDGGIGRKVTWVALGVAVTWAVVDLQGRVWENLGNRYEGLQVYLKTQQEVGDVVESIFLDATGGIRYAICADNTWHYDLTGCDIRPYSSIVSISEAPEQYISYDTDGSNVAQDGWETEVLFTVQTGAKSPILNGTSSDGLISENLRLESEIQKRDAEIASLTSQLSSAYQEMKELGDKAVEIIDQYKQLQQELMAERRANTNTNSGALMAANEIANRDFMLQQRLQTTQYNNQASDTAMMNMSTQFANATNNMAWNM